jgi:homopolymeric O-antigen transport system ATP-binding protein
VVRSGDRVEVEVELEVSSTVRRPHLSVTLQDSRFLIIGGRAFAVAADGTGNDGLHFARVRCAFQANLGAGSFFLSLRLEERQSDRLFLPIDKQVGLLRLEVIPSGPETFFGAVDLGLRLVDEDLPPAMPHHSRETAS